MVENSSKIKRRKTGSKSTTSPQSAQQFVDKAPRKGSRQPAGKPRRITYDCSTARYLQLKDAARHPGVSMNSTISAALDEYFENHPELLEPPAL